MTIAASLRAKQKSLGLSTFALAKKLRISYVAVARVLAGQSRPNRATIGKYAKLLGVGARELGDRVLQEPRGSSGAGRKAAAKRTRA